MQIFTYPVFWKFVYRYANLIITPFLLLYGLSLVTLIDKSLIMILPLIIAFILLYLLNKSYLEFYKIVPYKIEADEEKIVCSQFLFRNKTVTIYIKDIDSLSGGIFSGKYRGVMRVSDGKNKIIIGFFDKMKNSTKLVTLLLSKVDKKIYDDVIENIKSIKIGSELKK